MDIAEFGLERWFAKHEHEADIMLAESGIRSLDADRFDTDPGELGYVIPTNGDPEFRARIARRYDRSADEVLFTCGAQEANFLTFLSLLDEGDHAVVVTPTYQALTAVPDAVADVTEVPLSPPDWELDVDAVADAVRPETEVVVVNNPNNPTGRYHPEETIRALYDLAEDADAYLLCDEVYRLLAEEPLSPVASMGRRGISTASATKSHGLAGLRFGWAVLPEELVETAWNWKDYTTISPSIFGQHVAKQALGDQEDEILRENREHARRNHERVRAFLHEHELDWYDPVGVNGFVTVPDGFDDAREFCTAVVEEESVVLAPGDLFGHPDRFRIGFGLPADELDEGLERVGRVVERRA
ncbi:aminotransferase class I/II-fold pyridoxal phosphate-dependent enzyme [Halostella sp. JP-L12]|uniref:aminotransferase class I/II-fold pyridoxal phosphate-dependent enzyme n=1 Tax=Halostella TaxID=1843185 RepID=UPI000EF76584|nr:MULTISPECIES: aminotransferase class I/II-fold pyridoxal phosphate-dependent enzyme [Halostella]NHN47121.1 aminotransferase class I/II-fold pyridoxal phosphate-dependent enzyme [Halostella sp. JP-L12]